MEDFISQFFVAWLALVIYMMAGFLVVSILSVRTERAWIFIVKESGTRMWIAYALWPLTMIAVLLLQLHRRYRGSEIRSLDYTGKWL